MNRPKPSKTVTSQSFRDIRDWQAILVIAGAVLIFFRDILLQKAFLWEDFLYQFYPYRNFASVSLVNGEVPLWNPYTFAGMPFLADITGTVMYLPHFILLPFVTDGKLHFWYVEAYTVAHFLLAGVTMFYCARSFGFSRIGSLFSALVYMLSGFMIVHAIHLVIICQAAWFPLVLLLFRKMLDERSIGKMVLAGFVLSMVVCGGHIQITLYFFLFLFVFFGGEVTHLVREQKRTGGAFPAKPLVSMTLLAAGVIVIAIGLAAVQILPTMELANLSVREQITFQKASEGELWWQQLITLLVPKFFGSANHLGVDNPIPYWGPEKFWNYWETCIYTGLSALTLALIALLALKGNRNLILIAGFAVFAILYALGDNFIMHGFFYNLVPGFNKFRSIGRWGFFVAFAVALLSGYGLDTILNVRVKERRALRVAMIVVGVVLAVTIAVRMNLLDSFITWQIQQGALQAESPQQAFPIVYHIAASQTLIAAGFGLASVGFVILLLKRKMNPTLTTVLIFAIQFLDMYNFGFEQNNGTTNPDKYFTQRAALIGQIKEELKSEYFRVNMRNNRFMLFDRNQGMIDQIFLTEGYTQLALQRRFPPSYTYELLNAKYRIQVDTVLVQNRYQLQPRLTLDTNYLPRAFFVYNYRSFLTAEQESVFMASPSFNPRDVVALESPLADPPMDTASTMDWKVAIQSFRNHAITIRVSTPKKGILVVSEIFYPDWNAYVDGVQVPVYRADWSLRALVVDQGEHTVEMRFESKSFRRGLTISLATALLCLAGGGWHFMQSRKKIQKAERH